MDLGELAVDVRKVRLEQDLPDEVVVARAEEAAGGGEGEVVAELQQEGEGVRVRMSVLGPRKGWRAGGEATHVEVRVDTDDLREDLVREHAEVDLRRGEELLPVADLQAGARARTSASARGAASEPRPGSERTFGAFAFAVFFFFLAGFSSSLLYSSDSSL